MRSFTAMPRSETPTLAVLLQRAALVSLLVLGPVLAAACSRLGAPLSAAASVPVVAAASPSPSPQPSPSPLPLAARGTLAAVFPELGSLPAASTFTIIDESGGLLTVGSGSGLTRVQEECILTRTQADYAGTCFGRAGVSTMLSTPNASLERQYELPVLVPRDVAERFLQEIAAMSIADEPYKPILLPDSRFHRELRIVTDTGMVRVFSDTMPIPAPPRATSGLADVPWAVEYGGRQMVADAAAPSEAYRVISPYLDGVKKITGDNLREMTQLLQPSPSPSPVPR